MVNSHSLWIRLQYSDLSCENALTISMRTRWEEKKKQPTNQQYQNKRSNNNNNDRTRKWSTNIIRSARAIWPWKLFFIIFEYCYYYYKLRMRLLPFGYIYSTMYVRWRWMVTPCCCDEMAFNFSVPKKHLPNF